MGWKEDVIGSRLIEKYVRACRNLPEWPQDTALFIWRIGDVTKIKAMSKTFLAEKLARAVFRWDEEGIQDIYGAPSVYTPCIFLDTDGYTELCWVGMDSYQLVAGGSA